MVQHRRGSDAENNNKIKDMLKQIIDDMSEFEPQTSEQKEEQEKTFLTDISNKLHSIRNEILGIMSSDTVLNRKIDKMIKLHCIGKLINFKSENKAEPKELFDILKQFSVELKVHDSEYNALYNQTPYKKIKFEMIANVSAQTQSKSTLTQLISICE